MSTVAELIAQKAEIEKKIAEAQREERASAIAQVRALMAQHGLTMVDLASRSASSPRAATGKAVSRWPPSTATLPRATPGAAAASSPTG